MSRYAIKFPFRVRIHGGEFDESARAIHREDGLKTIQAESGIVLGSTIERKQMSTKTTFKRIALVTVAALGFGVMSVAPSNAAVLTPTFTLSAATTTVALGETAKTTLTTAGFFAASTDTLTSTVALATFPTTATSAQIGAAITVTATAVDTAVVYTTNAAVGTPTGTASQEVALTIGRNAPTNSVGVLVSGRTTLAVTPTAVGTYTYTITSQKVAGDTTTATQNIQTWTVVVTAPELLASTAFIGAAGAEATADATTLTTTSYLASTTAVARISTRQYQDAAKLVGMNTAATKAVTATISGAGILGNTAGTAFGSSLSVAAGTSTAPGTALNEFNVYPDGRTGKATITITVGSTVYTKTFTFTGVLATMTATASKKNVGVGETMTLTASGVDASTNAVAAPTVTAVSSDATVATVAASGSVVTVTGVKAGTATVTLTSGTITTTAAVTVLPVTSPTIAWKFDKDSYDAGEKMTLTITATGVADGARAAFTAAPVANFTLSSGSDALVASPVFAAGVATYTLYAPATPGTFKLTASLGQGIDTEVAKKKAADTADAAAVPAVTTASYKATEVSVSTNITNPALTAAQEATDAANEATDAGNNAKDAADQAIEAADAATIAAQDAAAAAEAAGEMAVEAAEAAGAIAQDALDAANAATDAALSAAEAADAATAAATEAKESADAATAAVAELSTKVASLMAALNAKVTTLSNLVAKIAKKVKA
jgi:trimeric autotransporter adhesin